MYKKHAALLAVTTINNPISLSSIPYNNAPIAIIKRQNINTIVSKVFIPIILTP
jgi:hypothetical protein